ncbi:DNA mismatch repair protein MutL [Apiospora rasikravindrae]|uniref:DNA mismatch repair protein MutL n=1 Tax=Apiospora rasikravindrae TaxID=990691 RepID=A0ABR1TXF4_9PEZI
MATIKPIEARTIHQIQSGQVIVDLCSVVKELVENSVDAGATNIEVRFKNQGLDAIEVQDNGSGISKENYETLALKHYTSKLLTYEDLTTLETFGFRGEALSSLCALSKFSVTTCSAADAPKGSRLEFETSGKLKDTSVVAAQKGTTVTVQSLFNNLPVRRRELERNIKREWNRVIGVLNQYACILKGVKFTVSQQPNKGKKIVLFSTKGNATTRDNIVNVFGAKTLTVLIPLDLKLEMQPTYTPKQQRTSTQGHQNTQEINILGHVSRPAHGEGRQTPDRQMFFVNGRPCGLPQFAKVFNEVYKSYNSSQSPFIFADIQLDTHMYDVNVSPDKRTIMLHDQSRMLDNLRESLVELFEAQDYSVPVSQLAGTQKTPFKKLTINRQDTVVPEQRKPEASETREDAQDDEDGSVPGDSSEPGDPSEQGTHDVLDSEHTSSNKETRSPSVVPGEGRGMGLISRWVRRSSPGRGDTTSATASPELQVKIGPSRSKEKFLPRLDESESSTVVAKPTNDAPSSSIEMESDGADRAVDSTDHQQASGNAKECLEVDDHIQSSEPPISSIPTPSRLPQSRPKPYSPSRFHRGSPEVATITIGNETVTSIIGSPAKRPRLDQQKTQESKSKRATKGKDTPLPSFQGRLTQMFSAASATKPRDTTELDALLSQDDSSESEERSRSSSRASSEGLFVEDQDDNASTNDAVAQQASPEPKEEEEEEINMSDIEADPSATYANSDGGEPEEVPASPSPSGGSNYEDEDDKKAREDNKVQSMIDAAEVAAQANSEETEKRQQNFVKGATKRKGATYPLLQTMRLYEGQLQAGLRSLAQTSVDSSSNDDTSLPTDNLHATDAEEKLSLAISKSDFGKMKVVGQFNLGFILAVRPGMADPEQDDPEVAAATDDELFIIDQHATDEKYNFERLQASTVVQSQRLVQPKTLELTAIEEEVIKENLAALEANGFLVSVDESGYQPVGSRCQLLSLPLSRETTFDLADLEELVSLLTDHPAASENTVPRPSKVRKMFAMRACRSSVMIGKSLPHRQMEKLVRHMGELDKPWNCPHGRPTMRHLCTLGAAWMQSSGWKEDDGFDGTKAEPTDWATYVKSNRTE